VPEGDTIHKIARAMAPRLEGRVVTGLWLRDRGWLAPLAGLHVLEVAPLGKHLLVALGEPAPTRRARWVLHVHLGMHGRWHRHVGGAAWSRPGGQALLRLAVESREAEEWVCFRAARAEVGLGPDLLGEALPLERIVARARGREPRSAADLLLDQSVACGIGNVYKSEVLFLEGVHPRTPPTALADATLEALYRRARELMLGNLGGWRRTTLRPVQPGRAPRPGEPRLWVYGRGGRPCRRCGARVAGVRLGDAARATWWCPSCQPAGQNVAKNPRSVAS
jgi:endonuclease-8